MQSCIWELVCKVSLFSHSVSAEPLNGCCSVVQYSLKEKPYIRNLSRCQDIYRHLLKIIYPWYLTPRCNVNGPRLNFQKMKVETKNFLERQVHPSYPALSTRKSLQTTCHHQHDYNLTTADNSSSAMNSISVYGYDPEMLSVSESLYFCPQSEDPPKAEQPRILRHRECPFLKLPYEVRALIYSYILPCTMEHPDRGIVWLRATAAMWITNRQVYKECVSLMYSNPTFLIDVRYDKVEFLYQWSLLHTSLVPKRVYDFPEPVAACNRPWMRKFYVRIHPVDSYLGMIKYNYSNPIILAVQLRSQVNILCAFLQDLCEIRELHISYHGGDSESHASLPLVMEPFRQLKNTKAVKVRDSFRINEGFMMKLQQHLTDAYTKNSLLRLPLELREHVYRHALPHTLSTGTGDKKNIKWHPGDISILCTCKQVNLEATRVLYATNEFEFSWMLKFPSHHDWQEEVSNCSDYLERSRSL